MTEDYKVVKCEQCGAEFVAYKTRRFCDNCRRLCNIACIRRHQATIPIEERRAAKRRYYHAAKNRRKEHAD